MKKILISAILLITLSLFASQYWVVGVVFTSTG